MSDITPATIDADAQQVSGSRVVAATPEQIFELLTDPARHGDIDGSGMVQQARGDQQRLALGSKFGMDMKMGPLYRITNTVVEFEEERADRAAAPRQAPVALPARTGRRRTPAPPRRSTTRLPCGRRVSS
ncbi:MAG: hypothetical protein R2697_03090 [Ilumatobacteraceae bacterium]